MAGRSTDDPFSDAVEALEHYFEYWGRSGVRFLALPGAGSGSAAPAPLPTPSTDSPSPAPPVESPRESLTEIRTDLGECTRCKLHSTRKTIVFGVGNPHAPIVFVGEGPGAEEDVQGLPFVGRAGQLLTRMLKAFGIRREDVYICNVVKCRPPENRAPEPDEVAACSPFLLRQIRSIRPKVVCTLGNPAMQTLLRTTGTITRLRGKLFDWEGAKLLPTFHPAFLLRNPKSEWEARADIKAALELAGLLPAKK